MPDGPAGATSPGRTGSDEVREAAGRIVAQHTRNPLGNSTRGGKLLSAMMMPFFRLRPSKGYAAITTTGRRSGKPRRKVIRAIRAGDTAYAVMLRPPAVAIKRPDIVSAWLLNIRADPNVRLRIRGGEFAAVVRELEQPEELERARRTFCEAVVPFDYGECKLHLRGLPGPEKIRELHHYWFDTGIPLAIDLAL